MLFLILNKLLKMNILNIKMINNSLLIIIFLTIKIIKKLDGIKDIFILYLNKEMIIILFNYQILMILIRKIENYLEYLKIKHHH